MRPPLRLLPLILGALLASAGHAPARAASDGVGASIHLDDASLPDPAKSPGDFSRDLAAADLCDMPIEDFAKTPPKGLCDDVFEEARVSADYRFQYACVFLVPPSIGGTQSRANIWLQPAAEAPLKATADAAVRKHICKAPGDLAEAQRLLAVNWVGAYRKFLLPGDKLAPIAKLERGPDDFGLLPPAPAEEGGASSGGGGAYGYDPAYGEGNGYGYGDGGGGAGPDDRSRQRRGSLQDDRRRQYRSGERDEAWRSRDTRAPWPRDRDGRRLDDGKRGPDGHEGAGRRPEMPHDGPRPGDGRSDDGRHHDGAGRDPDGRGGAVGPHPEMPHDRPQPGDGRPADGRRGMHSHDGPGDHRDGHDFGPYHGDRDGYHHLDGSRGYDPSPSFGGGGDDRPQRRPGFPSPGREDRDFGTNHPFEHRDGRFPPPRYARAQDVRPGDVRPNDVRPNNVRPNDVRPTRPGLGRPFYPGGVRHARGRGGGRRR